MARAQDDDLGRLREVWRDVLRRDPDQELFHGVVRAVLESIGPVLVEHPEYAEVVGRLCEPERVIAFRVPWVDDAGTVQVNRGFRVEFNSALGPYKGGLRFAPSVTLDVVKFLGFEQVFKNALTGQDIGGGKGGADVDPKQLSPGEMMRFCQSFATELAGHVGSSTDVPAGDMGVGPREIGWILGQYQRVVGLHEPGAFTGKPAALGGSALRPEATGYGTVYFTQRMLAEQDRDLDGARVVVSGSGNVALFAMDKVIASGGTVVGCSDSRGAVAEPDGVDVDALREVKDQGGSVADYAEKRSGATAGDGSPFTVDCDVALPCATQNEIGPDEARALVANGCWAVAEGANGPVTPEALAVLRKGGVAFGPGKAANAGGVAVSALEMQQAAGRERWSAEVVDEQLAAIMTDVHARARDAGERYCGDPSDLENGANAAGFLRVAEAMTSLGVV
ncbi:glutamate dehydrogenase [Actinomycetospora sp. NBRC 106375]|uniref:NADP-specific glutamate dehydrogenase n=1 Tax=Actinomycetospora sp. NBRC 106375 TaxID=3032207 RepID=UPI0024A4C583|nr:NADP-specific glutamate dehydrogenase [Actinomycetospora sp. NBRC 106375]GLZ44884.1 glutamate dehydrogenase [Actinomycetospora sp. NBRC 106375]